MPEVNRQERASPTSVRLWIRGGVFALAAVLPEIAASQTAAGDWNSSWQFSNVTRRTLTLQQADLIAKMENGFYDSFGPAQTTVINNTNTDNRSNYIETINEGEGVGSIENKIGDDIGQNTNTVGSMNTGSTTIEVTGSNNEIDAYNTSRNTGCLDGSINTASNNALPEGRSAQSVLSDVLGASSVSSSVSMNAGATGQCR